MADIHLGVILDGLRHELSMRPNNQHGMVVATAHVRTLVEIAHRACIARGALWVADEDRYVVNYILDNTIPPGAGVAVQED